MLEHWLALFGAVLLSSVSQMLLKKSAGKEHKSVIFEYLNPWVISGYFLLAASTICVIFAFKGVDFKNGPVIESLGFPLVMILGRIFYGEKLTNIENSLKLLPEGAENIGIVTNDFHIFRALATARHVSALNFSGIPAPSTGYGFTHYAMREFFAVGAGLIKGELSF